MADLVGSLVDKSLVAIDRAGADDRYHLLETIRQYAAERLLEEGETAVRSVAGRHAEHYLSLATTAEHFLTGPEQVHWMRRLSADDENLRRAVEHLASDRAGTEQLFRFAKALGAYWLADVPFAELSELLLPRLADPPAEVDRVLYGYALLVGAGLNRFHLGAAMPLVERALAVARETGDERLLVIALAGSADCSFILRASSDGLPLAEEAVERARRLQDPVLLAASLGTLMTLRAETDPQAVPALLEEALAAAALAGNKRAELSLLNNAAVVALRTGRSRWPSGSSSGPTSCARSWEASSITCSSTSVGPAGSASSTGRRGRRSRRRSVRAAATATAPGSPTARSGSPASRRPLGAAGGPRCSSVRPTGSSSGSERS